MTKEELIASAAELPPPGEDAAQEYMDKGSGLAAKVTASLRANHAVSRVVGQENFALMANNHVNHAQYMASVFYSYSPQSFVESVLWVYRTYTSHGFKHAYWPLQLTAWLEHMRRDLSPRAYEELSPFYRWLLDHHEKLAVLSRDSETAWEGDPTARHKPEGGEA